jgi:hypothetical protein
MCDSGWMRNSITFSLSEADNQRLSGIVAAPLSPQKYVWRARIILLSSDGLGTSAIMSATGKSRPPGKAPVPLERVAEIVRLTQDPSPHEATH